MENLKPKQDPNKSLTGVTDLGGDSFSWVVSLEHLNGGPEADHDPSNLKDDSAEFKIPNKDIDQAIANHEQNRQDALKDAQAAYDKHEYVYNSSGDLLDVADLDRRLRESDRQGSPNFGDPRKSNPSDHLGVGLGNDNSRHSSDLIPRPNHYRSSRQLNQELKDVKGMSRIKPANQMTRQVARATLQTVSKPFQAALKSLKKFEDRMRDRFKDFYA